jgi:hypothetical protein
MPASSSNASVRYPGAISAGRAAPIASLPTTASAGTCGTGPENSRLIVSSNGNEAACRNERDLRGAGRTVEGQDFSAPPGESPNTYTFTRHAIRSNYIDKSIDAKKKVPAMKYNCHENKNNVYEFIIIIIIIIIIKQTTIEPIVYTTTKRRIPHNLHW